MRDVRSRKMTVEGSRSWLIEKIQFNIISDLSFYDWLVLCCFGLVIFGSIGNSQGGGELKEKWNWSVTVGFRCMAHESGRNEVRLVGLNGVP